MGNGQSIFYPDNGNRRDRAEQLANDCKNLVNSWKDKRASLEEQLGPYKEKLDKVLAAFGCETVHELDRVVQERATGEALKDWNRTKSVYDATQIVDQVIMGVMGVVAIAGFAISTVGALAGGFGFFAGLAVTSDILLVLGVIGAIFDIINGAIQREKLRDAINRLFDDRMQCKQSLAHLDNLFVWLPIIKDVYQTYEDLGYSAEKIIDRLRKKKLMNPLEEDQQSETFSKAASDLHDMDVRRGSWTNEDPDWESGATDLDNFAKLKEQILGPVRLGMTVGRVSENNFAGEVEDFEIQGIELSDPPPPYEEHIRVSLVDTGSRTIPPSLDKVLDISLGRFVDMNSAEVIIRLDEKHFLGIDKGHVVGVSGIDEAVQWALEFADPSDVTLVSQNFDVLSPEFAVRFVVSAKVGDESVYVGENGALVNMRARAEEFVGKYAV